jgi:two-component system sensor histidine kinase VicK
MEQPKRIRSQPLQIAVAAVGGLLVFIAVVGVVGLVLNHRITDVTSQALTYDVELEDQGDDLRVAVLDVRHYQRNIYFEGLAPGNNISRNSVSDFEGAYATLQQEIDELEELGVQEEDVPQPEELRAMAEEYYDNWRSTFELAGSNEEAFIAAHDRALVQIERLDLAAEEIDKLGEQRSSEALDNVRQTSQNAELLLLAVIGGLVLVGTLLAYAAVRVVAELRRLYDSEQRAVEALADANRAKTDFIADASHELRTPLTVLHGNAQIGMQLEDRPEQREIFEDILRESTRMSRMVEDLLFLARSDSSSLPLHRETVDAQTLLEGLAHRAEMLAQERGVTFSKDLRGSGRVDVDPARIEQAVLVFVDNAAKYCPPGTPVELISEIANGELRVAVEDRGPGIPEEDLSRIFERFYRVDKTRARKQGGSGLGLSIARTIAEAHSGRVEAESRVGEGTKMILAVPLASRSVPQEGRETAVSHSR